MPSVIQWEFYVEFGNDESFLKRNLLILSQLVGPKVKQFTSWVMSLVQVQDDPIMLRKRIEETFNSFMHILLDVGGYNSIGKVPLLQLGCCDYGSDVQLSKAIMMVSYT